MRLSTWSLIFAAALPHAAVAATATPVAPEVLPFIADDYGRAEAAAKVRQLPLFVEAWAPW